METKKKCYTCKVEKEFIHFYKDKRRKFGLYDRCKACHNQAQRNKIDKMIEDGLRPPKKYTVMSEEVKQEILDLYRNGIGAYSIAKKHSNYSKSSILQFLKKNGEVRAGATYRKYKFKNENYFDVIDTDDKAYFLGLLWADGCNYRRDIKHKNAYQIHLSLQEQDGYIVRELANKIYYNDNIVKLVDKSTKYDDYKRQNQISLRIPSKHVSDTLLNYGMTPRKSSDLIMPINIIWTDETIRSFIRGFFDGDGSIFYNNNSKQYGLSIISGVDHMKQMNEIINPYFGKLLHLEIKTCYSVPMAYLKLHGNQTTKKFLDWLYKDSTIHLDRKYEKYLELKNIVESKSNQSSTTSTPS